MMLTLVRRDEALRKLPVWGVLLFLNASVLLGILFFMAAKERSAVSATAVALLAWATLAIHLAVGSSLKRASDLDLALPVSARPLWLAHLLSVVLGGALLTLAILATAALQARVLKASVTFDADLGGLALLLGAATWLAAVLLQAPRPSLVRVPLSAGLAAWAALVLLAPFGLIAALVGHALAGGVVLSALAALATVAGVRRVPRAFVVAPADATAGRASARAAAPSRSVAEDAGAGLRRARLTVWLATWRSLSLDAKELLAYPFLALVGVFLAGAFDARASDAGLHDMRYAYIPLGTYLLYTIVAPRLSRLHHLDPLPLPRKLLAAGLLLPTAATFLLSFAAGAAAARYGPRTEYVNFEQNRPDGGWAVSVPLRAYRVAWDGKAPAIASPWGESHPAEALRPCRASRSVIWNPFSAPPGSSARFVALQLSRAAEAVYGASIPPEEIEGRWLRTLPDGIVAGRHAALPLRAEYRDLEPRSGPTTPIVLALVLAPWLLLVAALLRAFRAGVAERTRHVAFWGVVGLFLLTMFGAAAAMIAGFARPWVPRALVEIPAFGLEGSAGFTALVWGIAALLVLAAYRLAESQFLRMEIPTKPVNFSLAEWMRRDR